MGNESLKTHKDLAVWIKAIDLAVKIYHLTEAFPRQETYGLSAQIRRSSVSIPSNIAEGAARNTKKEFTQSLYIALGSLAELETQLILSERLGFFTEREVFEEIVVVRRMILGLIKHLKDRR
jgi:four helix bundle protein